MQGKQKENKSGMLSACSRLSITPLFSTTIYATRSKYLPMKAANTALSRVRIFIEHAIGGMKRSNILVHTFRNRLVLCHSLIVWYIGSQAIVSFDEIARETLLFSLDRALACSF
jgi:hypothetical protein